MKDFQVETVVLPLEDEERLRIFSCEAHTRHGFPVYFGTNEKESLLHRKGQLISRRLSRDPQYLENLKPKKNSWSSIAYGGFLKSQPSAAPIKSLGIVILRLMVETPLPPKQPFQITPRGLLNTGNLCFMNSVLQLLLFCTPFYTLLKNISKSTLASLGESKTPLLDATIAFIDQFSHPETVAVSPETFYMAISSHLRFSHLKWGRQEDAEEFLGYLLDGLHEEFVESIASTSQSERNDLANSISRNNDLYTILDSIDKSTENDGWCEVGSNRCVSSKRSVKVEPSPITHLFGGQFRSELQVPKQKESKSITLDPFLHVQLDIDDVEVNDLESAFRFLSKPEQIPFRTKNGTEVMARKQNFIDSLPRVLIIHLKRFSFNPHESRVEKLRKPIKYTHSLQVPLECISKATQLGSLETRYKLIGVVYHHGTSTEGGHYTVDVLRQEAAEWVRIDDTIVESITPDMVVGENGGSKTAYLLMYQRV